MRTAKETLVYWINEREGIRERKEDMKAPSPWTEDDVMARTYFCNIHREDDKVTRWIRERWKFVAPDVHTGYTILEVEPPYIMPNMCMARLVNRISSLEALGWPWTEFYPKTFAYHASLCKPFWGSAYVVTTHGLPMSKVEYASNVLSKCFELPLVVGLPPTLAAYHQRIMQYEGFGSFMAAQVVADLKNTIGNPLAEAEDWLTWSSHGPGSLRGLSWYHNIKATPSQYQRLIFEAWQEVEGNVPDMCMQDFQNCLCEYDKYMRVSTGAGKSKRKYNGT